jgi:protein-S-isoprenylcysteine O-methyltransferase Ste14
VNIGIALSIVFGLGWLPLFVFRAESLGEALPSYRGSERFWVLAAPVILAVHVTASCIVLNFGQAVPVVRAAISLLVFASGIAFWLWARAVIGPIRARRLPDQPPERLRRDGPFGVVRNPLYLGVLVAAAGPALAAAEPLLAVSYVLSVAALAIRAVQEERRLHAQLGPAYAEYCREVPCMIPFVW